MVWSLVCLATSPRIAFGNTRLFGMLSTTKTFFLPSSSSRLAFVSAALAIGLAYGISKAMSMSGQHTLAVLVMLVLICLGVFVFGWLTRIELTLGADELHLRLSGVLGPIQNVRYADLVSITRGNGAAKMLRLDTRNQGVIVVGPWLATIRRIDGDLEAIVEAVTRRIAAARSSN